MRAYNKVTRVWADTLDGLDLFPVDDWLVEPTFTDEEFAMQIGQEYWTFTGNNVGTPTVEEYAAINLQKVKDDVWESIKEERDRRKLEGGYLADGNWYHSDTSSRIQQIGLVMMGANMPPNLYWKTMSGGFVVMTQTLAMQIFMAAATSDATIFAIAEQKKAAMLASADPANYDYLSGWPMVFGE